jgi:hypothetical protein
MTKSRKRKITKKNKNPQRKHRYSKNLKSKIYKTGGVYIKSPYPNRNYVYNYNLFDEAFNFFIANSTLSLLSTSSSYGIIFNFKLLDSIESSYYFSLRSNTMLRPIKNIILKLVFIMPDDMNLYDFNNTIEEKHPIQREDFINEVKTQIDIYKHSKNDFEPICPSMVYTKILNVDNFERFRKRIMHFDNDEGRRNLEKINEILKTHNGYKIGIIAMENMENTTALGDIDINMPIILCLYEHYRLFKLGYFHGDVHLFNSLFERNTNYIKDREGEGRVTLIDFGKTYKCNEIPNWQIRNDIMDIIYASFYDKLFDLITTNINTNRMRFYNKRQLDIIDNWIDNNTEYIVINKISNELQKEITDIFNSTSLEWKNKYIDMFKDNDSFNANFVLKDNNKLGVNDNDIINSYKTFWRNYIENILDKFISLRKKKFEDMDSDCNFFENMEPNNFINIDVFKKFINMLINSNHDPENTWFEIFLKVKHSREHSREHSANRFNIAPFAIQFNEIINGRDRMIAEVKTKMEEHGIDTNINAYLTYYGGAVGTLQPMSVVKDNSVSIINKKQDGAVEKLQPMSVVKDNSVSIINQTQKLLPDTSSNFKNLVFTDAYFEDVKTDLKKMNTTIPKLYEKEEEIHKQLLSDITNNH